MVPSPLSGSPPSLPPGSARYTWTGLATMTLSPLSRLRPKQGRMTSNPPSPVQQQGRGPFAPLSRRRRCSSLKLIWLRQEMRSVVWRRILRRSWWRHRRRSPWQQKPFYFRRPYSPLKQKPFLLHRKGYRLEKDSI